MTEVKPARFLPTFCPPSEWVLTRRITEQSRQALAILLALARAAPNAATANQVAEAVGLPETTIFKALKTLTRAELVATVRGRGGGMRLARPADHISQGDVLRACEPRFVRCEPAARLTLGATEAIVDRPIEQAMGRCIAAFLGEADAVTLSTIGPGPFASTVGGRHAAQAPST